MHTEHFRSADLRTPYNSTTWRVPSVRMNARPQHETLGRKGTFESPSDEENNMFTDFTASILGAMRHEIKKKKNKLSDVVCCNSPRKGLHFNCTIFTYSNKGLIDIEGV